MLRNGHRHGNRPRKQNNTGADTSLCRCAVYLNYPFTTHNEIWAHKFQRNRLHAQISLKSDAFLLIYGDFTVFKMAAVRYLEFLFGHASLESASFHFRPFWDTEHNPVGIVGSSMINPETRDWEKKARDRNPYSCATHASWHTRADTSLCRCAVYLNSTLPEVRPNIVDRCTIFGKARREGRIYRVGVGRTCLQLSVIYGYCKRAEHRLYITRHIAYSELAISYNHKQQ